MPLSSRAVPPSWPVPAAPVTRRTFSDPGLWIIAGTAILLWIGGFPKPHIDDLFFSGAGVELARSGQLVNPWIAPWMMSLGTDRFYAQPPVLPYAIAGWVTVFGVSASSLTAFHLVAQAVVCGITFCVARRRGVSRPIALAASAVILIFLVEQGMRPEALALALIAASQITFATSSGLRMSVSALLAAAATLTHPLFLSLAVPLHAWRGLEALRTNRLQAFTGATAIGLGVAFVAFVAAIRGEVVEFVQVMRLHSSVIAPPWSQAPANFWGEFTLGKQAYLLGPAWLLILVGATCTLRIASPGGATLRSLWVCWLAATLIGIFFHPTRMVHYATHFGLVLAIVSFGCSPWRGLFTTAALTVVAIQHAAIFAVPLFGDIRSPNVAWIKAAIARHPGRTLCIDDVAARYIYDFKLPPGSVDWTQRQSTRLGSSGTLAAKPSNELWIATEWKIEHSIRDSVTHAERLKIGSARFGSIARQPYQLVVIE